MRWFMSKTKRNRVDFFVDSLPRMAAEMKEQALSKAGWKTWDHIKILEEIRKCRIQLTTSIIEENYQAAKELSASIVNYCLMIYGRVESE